MKFVTVTLRLRLKTDPTDPVQLNADLAEVLQEYIDDEGLASIADVEEDEEDEDYEGDNYN